MRGLMKIHLKMVGIAIVLLPLGSAQAAQRSTWDLGYAAMPQGVTLQPLGSSQGYGAQRLTYHARHEIVLANASGKTLYTYDRDQDNKSVCLGECAKEWLPTVPLAKAKATTNWKIISRSDGLKQWSYKGKPLYTSIKDKNPGEVGGGGVGAGDREGRGDPTYGYDGPARVKLTEGWRPAMFQTGGNPVIDLTRPLGVNFREIPDANGIGIVDAQNMTIYAYNGSADKDALLCKYGIPCKDQFVPVVAPQLAEAAGDWSIALRKDGIHQWVFKGKSLYKFTGDLVPFDVLGKAVDARWGVALVLTYFQPPEVKLRADPGLGMILSTLNGKALYHRDVQAFIPGSRQSYHNPPYRPNVGRSIRKTECVAECLQQFKPFLAPTNAEPQGYWGIAIREDGSKQWTYKDFTLYTFSGDTKPGDLNANELYDLQISDDPKAINDVGFPVHSGAGMFWMYSSL